MRHHGCGEGVGGWSPCTVDGWYLNPARGHSPRPILADGRTVLHGVLRPMLTAVTRSPGPELARCELAHLPRVPIDFDRALAQHHAYQAALRSAGVRIIELPADASLPDGVFVEDIAVVLDEIAVITSPTPPS